MDPRVPLVPNRLAAALAVLALAAVAAPSLALRLGPPPVPAAIQVPAGNRVFLVAHARGTQNYACGTGGTWGPATPQADLYDDHGNKIGIHFAGPTWQYRDGSTVHGAKLAAVTVDATAIPWLLLKAASTSAGADGDRLVKTTYIQRVVTTGGLTQGPTCTTGATDSEAYTADYYFYCADTDTDGE